MSAGDAGEKDRATGRTTRTLWRALLVASAGDDDVAVVVQSTMLARFTFEKLLDLLTGVAVRIVGTERAVYLPNGKRVAVVAACERERQLRGWGGQVVEDHP